MTTVINTPPAQGSSDSGVGIVLGVIVGLLLVTLFFVYVLPALRGADTQKDDSVDINLKLSGGDATPAGDGGNATAY